MNGDNMHQVATKKFQNETILPFVDTNMETPYNK